MKRMIAHYSQRPLSIEIFRTTAALLLGVALASGFWIVSVPMARAQSKQTPVQMIQSHLPSGKTIGTATDKQLFDALCKTVKESPQEASSIVRTAAKARKNLRGDILCMTIRCLRDDKGFDCSWVVEVVRDWIKDTPDMASKLTDLVANCSPECGEMLQAVGEGGFVNPPSNVNQPPGSVGGGGSTNPCVVCQNGRDVQVSCEDLASYLSSHPGAMAGPCGMTPTTNR